MKQLIHAGAAAIAILGSAIAAESMIPRTLMSETGAKIDYAGAVPLQFGDWSVDPNVRLIVPVEQDALANRIYSQMVGRGYVDRRGNAVMLLIAYGPRQSDLRQLHRPEVCYVAEGFRVVASRPDSVALIDKVQPVEIRRMTAQRENRTERISYWMRIGDDVVSDLLERQYIKFRYGLRGIIPDGVLIRVSSINQDEPTAKALHDRFLKELLRAIGPENLPYFVGNSTLAPKLAAR